MIHTSAGDHIGEHVWIGYDPTYWIYVGFPLDLGQPENCTFKKSRPMTMPFERNLVSLLGRRWRSTMDAKNGSNANQANQVTRRKNMGLEGNRKLEWPAV